MSLKLVRRPRSQNWIIRGTFAGVRIEESSGTDSLEAAELLLAKRQTELARESVFGKSATASFSQAALSYLEADGDTRFLKKVVEHFGETALANIDQDALDRAARKLYPNAGPATRNRQFYTPVAAVLHHAAKRGWCHRPIIERPTMPRGRIRWLKPADADRLIDACAPHLKPLVTFLFGTGARVGEALWLDWHDVDLDRAHVTFPKTKNGDARGIPIPERVVGVLKGLLPAEGMPGGVVFRKPDGSPYARPRSIEDHSAGTRIKKGFGAACRRAGIDDFHPHDCRHTWATWHYQANRDIGSLQRLGGWKSIQMVMRYAHTDVGELAHTVNRVAWGTAGDSKGSERILFDSQ